MKDPKDCAYIGQISPDLVRRVATNLGLSDEDAGCLPFIPVVVVGSLDAEAGPRFNPSDEGTPLEVLQFDLTTARDREKIFPEVSPVDEIFVDFFSAAGSAQLFLGAGRFPITLSSALQPHWSFRKPLTGGLYLSHAAQAGITLRIGLYTGKSQQ